MSYHTLIVGGGLSGLTCGIALARHGKRVAIVNAAPSSLTLSGGSMELLGNVDGKMVGKIGVIGPTRMKYDEVTSVVEYLTDNISKAFMLTEGEKDDS